MKKILPKLIIIRSCAKTRKKRKYQLVDFFILADHRVRIKENKKIDKYLDLDRELKKL